MLNLKAFRSKAAGLPDLLNYAALIAEGVVQGKDGSLMAGFFYRGDDNAVSTYTDRNYICAMVNNYLARFGAGWAVWVDAARLDSPGYPEPHVSHFPEPITAMIDAERRRRFEQAATHYESEYALIVQYLPPLRREAKLSELVYDDDARAEIAPGDRQLANFERRLRDLEEGFADLLHMRRMRTLQVTAGTGDTYASDELVNYLHFTLTGETIALRIPDCPMYLDAWLGTPELWPGDTPKLGSKFISCVAIEGMPGFTCPGILDLLDNLALSYRWSTRFIFMEQHEADKALNAYRRKWQQKIRGFWSQIMKTQKGVVNTDAVAMMHEAERAMSEAKSGEVVYGYYTPVVVLMHENREILEEQARYVRREVERKGFGARVETVNCMEAWLGSLPGHPYPNIRRPLIHTLNLADLMPLSSVWPGLRENPCDLYPAGSPPLMQTVTTGATPFRLNLHVGDVGHTLIFGPTGAGKSTLLATVHAQARRYRSKVLADGSIRPMTITAFDKGRSLYALCKATGGVHYDIGEDEATVALAPLQYIDSDKDMLWAEEWIATCFQLQTGTKPNPQEKASIHRAMLLLRDAAIGDRSLTSFVSNVQDLHVRDALNYYTISGSMGHILDGLSNDVKIAPYTVFEIDELMNLGDTNAIPVLLCLFRQFEQSLKGQPAILSLDEAWVMLGHPVFREKLREWLKELRKKNCLVLLATQSLSDAVNSGLMDVLLEQCPTKIMLPNREALQTADLYKSFGLNEREIDLIRNATPKRQYYYKSPLGRRVFELGLDPLALSFVAVSDKVAIDQIRQLEQDYGSDWPVHWLSKRGVNYAQYTN